MNYKVPSPAWAVGFQKLAREAGVTCYVEYLDQAAEEMKRPNTPSDWWM